MTYLQAAILGVVQGVAEFLPISSSGHLTLFQHFFGMEEPDSLYNILLHFATLIAVCIYYWKDIWEMILEFFRGIASLGAPKGRHEAVPPARRLVMLVIVGTLPLFLVLPIQDKVEALGANPTVVSCILLVTGLILFAADRIARGGKDASNATWMDALLVGVAQGLATLPGLSRSGSTIAAGMALGFDRKFAVRYSFLLSLPAVLGATLLKVLQVHRHHASAHVSGGNGLVRRGGIFLHQAGQSAGGPEKIRRLRLLLLGCRYPLPLESARFLSSFS